MVPKQQISGVGGLELACREGRKWGSGFALSQLKRYFTSSLGKVTIQRIVVKALGEKYLKVNGESNYLVSY